MEGVTRVIVQYNITWLIAVFVDSCCSLIHDVNLEIIRFPEYGKNFAKSVKMSPDAFIQSALQLAYYK